MAAFGALQARELQGKTQQVQDRREPWHQRYPDLVPAYTVALQIGGIAISGALQGLRRSPQGTYLLLQQRVGAVLAGEGSAQAARGHVVVGLWVEHLAACASGVTLTSVQLGLDGEVVFAPLTAADASTILQGLVDAYAEAWRQPLPVACKTAWAFLQTERHNQRQAIESSEKEAKDPHDAAQSAFEGSFQSTGERDSSSYLMRAFEGYDDLEQALPGWAHTLYDAMANAAAGAVLGVRA
jgi:exodeoxyribonuclease V gamma subunit